MVNKKAFTLIELLIVLIIIGVVYTLFNPKLTNKKEISRFEDLKKFLVSKYKPPIKLECFGQKCEKCFVNNKELKEYQIFTSKPKTYLFDTSGYISEKEFEDDKCFEYQIYKNKSSENILVEKDNQFYVFYSYFKKPKVFANYDDALNEYDNKNFLPQDNYEFYSKAK